MTWIPLARRKEAPGWLLSEPKIQSLKSQCEGWFIAWGTGIDFIKKGCRELRTSCSTVGARLFLFMDASGIVTYVANSPGFPSPALTFGCRSWKGIAYETGGTFKP